MAGLFSKLSFARIVDTNPSQLTAIAVTMRCAMPNLLLARHAESVYNAQGRISCDPADTRCVLSESGKTQAETLGRELQGCHLDLCITSELLRTRQTADVALATREVRRTVLPDFNDPLAGDFEGRALSDYRSWVDANGGVNAVPPGGGESLETAFRRFARGYGWLANRNEAEILVIAHALPISALLSALDGGPIEGRMVEYATIHRVTGEQLREAIQYLTVLGGHS
jgi:broad specificity phosphatase PhoE